jgi:hypothetical protein
VTEFAAMGKVDGHESVLVRGEGCRLRDADGPEYLDATTGLWFVNVGHGRAEIAHAVAGLVPLTDAAVFFGGGGRRGGRHDRRPVRRYEALAHARARPDLRGRGASTTS